MTRTESACTRAGAARRAAALIALSAGWVEPSRAAAANAAPALSAGSIAQALLGLVVVLGLVVAAAWLLKRFSNLGGTASGLVRIVGAAAVGQRERIVVVEVGGTWLLVGVAPGQVRALHTMPRGEAAIAPAPSSDAGFAAWLRRVSEKRRHD